jgi:antitoxin (DNA-binding transcriptional repressor) of toxin-antitoxin stability system
VARRCLSHLILVRSCTMVYMARLSVSEARAILPEVLDRVERGEEITITRHGRPAAVLLRPDAVRTRRGEAVIERAREVAALVSAGRERPLPAPVVSGDHAREWAEAVRADRDR